MTLRFCAGYDVVNSTFGNRQDIRKVNCIYRPWYNNSMSYAFYNCYNLINVSQLNNNINNMSYAFQNCYNLVGISKFPNNVRNIVGTFQNCENITNIPTLPTSITSIVNTFYGCSTLYNVPVIPNNVINMSGTFYGCSNISQFISIPNRVNDISYTFCGCSNIESIDIIPSNITNMYKTFDGCTNLIGDIYIITNASNCFYNTPDEKLKDVYIYFSENGVNTPTYNAFINAGYSDIVRVNGALLINNDDAYDIDLSDYRYEIDSNKIAHLYEYIGTKTRVDQPEVR